MKKQWAICFLTFLAVGCNTLRGPSFEEARISPEVLHPGDEGATVLLKVADRNHIIDRIEGIVQEDPRFTFRPRDDGKAPDEKAGDGVWTLQVDVPFNAPSGEFTLEFTAYRGDGLPITVRGDDGQIKPLSIVVPVAITYPAEQP